MIVGVGSAVSAERYIYNIIAQIIRDFNTVAAICGALRAENAAMGRGTGDEMCNVH